MMRLTIFCFGLILAACGAAPASQVSADAPPKRIVSLDYCADQFVLKFAPRERILAVSPDAGADFSYMREAAIGLPRVRPVEEDVLLLKPDLIVRSYGGGPNATAYFERAGIPVLEVGWAGDIEAVMANIERLASELGAPEEGREVVADMNARLASLTRSDEGETILYMTPGGVTSGPGSLVHNMLIAAGLSNFQTEPGWRPIPLERLAYETPDRIALARFGSADNPDAWSAAAHPIARAHLNAADTVQLDGAATSCGGWFLVDAVEALANGSAR